MFWWFEDNYKYFTFKFENAGYGFVTINMSRVCYYGKKHIRQRYYTHYQEQSWSDTQQSMYYISMYYFYVLTLVEGKLFLLLTLTTKLLCTYLTDFDLLMR